MRWMPDTCGCAFERSVSEDGVVTLSKVLKQCEAHAAIRYPQDVYNAVREENRRKNIAVNAAQKAGVKGVRWSFDENRDVVLSGVDASVVEGMDRVKVST